MMSKSATRPILRMLGRFYASTSSGVEAAASSTTSTTQTVKQTLPVTGHKLAYSEFGDPSAVIRRERFQIDAVPENHVVIIIIITYIESYSSINYLK